MKLTKFPIVKAGESVKDNDGYDMEMLVIPEKSLIIGIETISKAEIKALEHIEVNGVKFWNMNKK